ncbi:Lrp/AsnC family transcriptional regulator for asnA, asnC and gidA [Sphingomonas zeicaulis]|uniref:Lrp/AsnC family transcriptional regulator n=1 Tax=Sphingomonas zeicaulis TaxID=1632740 RepID=UPI003D1EAFEA
MTAPDLDETDRHILDLLGDDARLSNRALARRLGLVEGTIRTRVKRLTERSLLRFTAITDHRQHGSPRLTFLRIRTDLASGAEIARAVSALPDVRSTIMMLGPFNILAIALFEDENRHAEVAMASIGAMPGVLAVESAVVIKSLKYNERVAKLNLPHDG